MKKMILFLLLLDGALDLSNAFGHRNTFGTDVRAPPHGIATPGAIIVVELGQPAAGGGVP